MGIETKYRCDKCRVAQPTSEQMWRVEFGFQCIDSHRDHLNSITIPHITALWCRNCMEEAHLLSRAQTKEAVTAPKPTLEDLLREVIREEIQQ